ncbi:MAG: DnaA/Hda family protein [Candidatus Thermoplasmatota archaeon]|nr:DnaA/Hda family protein [Candidatus Thermoplasmatota archaeon]
MERSRRFLGLSENQIDSSNRESTLLDHISIRTKGQSEKRFLEHFDIPSDAPGPLERLSILSGDETDYAEIVHTRLEAMRGRILGSSPLEMDALPSDLPAGIPRWVVGEDSGGIRDGTQPIWREVLDKQRNISPHEPLGEAELGSPQILDSGTAPTSANHAGFWPPLLTSRPGSDFSRWQRGPSNRMATQAANEVIDYPSVRLNPLLIYGGSGTGKSHLLWAIGESLQSGSRDVRLVTSETFPAEELPAGWDDLLMRASSLLVDDADRIITRPKGAEMLAKIVGWAIDIGSQVILTSSRKLDSESLPIGRLRQAVASGVHVEIGIPSEETLLLYLRRISLSRGISLTDPQLSVIASRSRGQWSRVKADFETVSLSIEAGAELFGADDVRTLLSGKEPPMRDENVQESIDADSIGAKIVTDVLDYVLPEPAEHRVEIISEELDVEDDYTPPEISLSASHEAVERLASDQLRGHLQEIEARHESASSSPELFAGSSLELLTDSAFSRLEDVIHEHRFEMRELNEELSSISDKIGSASESELVSFADRMLSIEAHLEKLHDLTSGNQFPEVEDFDPGDLLQPVTRKVLMPKTEKREMKAILRPVKRRVLLPVPSSS